MKNGEKNVKLWWQPALMMFARLTGWIAVPVIIGAFLGKWLDKKNDSEPWLFLISVGMAFFISMIGVIRNGLVEFKKIEKENSLTDEKNNNLEDDK